MNTAKHLLLENDGTDRIKLEFDFDYNYENDNNKEGTFTCRNCKGYNGEFKTIKMGDIFTHITHFRTPGEDLCAQCDTLDGSSSTKEDHNDIKPLLNINANTKNTPNGKSSSTITNNNNNNTIMNNNNNNTTTSKIHINDNGSTLHSDITSSTTNLNLIQFRTMEDRNNNPHDLESTPQQQLQGIINHPQSIPVTVPTIITPNNLSTTTNNNNNNTLLSFDGKNNNGISIKSETPVIATPIGHNSNNNNNTNTNSNQENILSHSQFNRNCSQNPTNNLNLNESTYTFSMTNSSSSLHEVSSSIPTQSVGVDLPMTFIISHPQLQHDQSSSPLSSSSNPTSNSNNNNNSTLLDTATTTTTTLNSVSNTLQSTQQQQQVPGIISDLGNTSYSNGPSTLSVLSGIPSSSSTNSTITNNNNTTDTTINSKKFVCKTCGAEFKNKKTKNLHIQRVHEKLERYFCHICPCKFAYRGSLDSHLASHTTPEITHDCPKCPRKFKEKSNLTNHMKIHSDNPKKFCCEFCPSQFSKRVNLRYHCKRKHPDEYLNSSAFSSPNINNNNTHVTTGTGSSQQSQQQSNNNNNNNNNMSYNIPMSSPSGFTSTTTKDTPNNNNNNNNTKEKPPGNFKCEHCGRTFLFKNNLKAHLRVHTKDKKYTCDICEKSFIYKESLKNHMLLHTQELPYECHICQKKFRDRSNRRKHVKNVHKLLFLNGEDGTGSPTGGGGTANIVKNGTSPHGKPNDNNNTTTTTPPPKKRRNNNKKNTQNDSQDSTNKTPSGNSRKKAANNNNTKATNSNPRNNNNKSVIVSTANNPNVMLDQDRKIIMSPKNAMSPLEYSHLPVTVHVPAGGLHQHYISTTNRNQNVIVKAGSVPSSTTTSNIPSPQPDLDLYHRSQNVIVYSKSKGNDNYTMEQNSVISHNNLLPSSSHLPHSQSSQQQQQQQQQYYRVEESFDTRQNPQPTYMTLPISSPQSNSQPSNITTYDFVSSQEPVPIKIEQDHSHNNNSSNNPNIQNTIRFGSEDHESIQQTYSAPMYIHPDPHQQHHQYWTIATSSPNNPTGVPTSTNVSSPYSTSSTTNVSYVSPITAASNVLNNGPHPYVSDIHHHPTPGEQPPNTYYNYDLSKFDFSFL